MRRTLTATAAVLAALILPGCSTHTSTPPKATPHTTPSASAKTSTADAIAACTDAIADGKDQGDGAPECADLSPDDYLKALQAANQKGRSKLQQEIDGASASAAGR
jgi:hypothetical protein